jgi:acyl-CoA dehydrogenase
MITGPKAIRNLEQAPIWRPLKTRAVRDGDVYVINGQKIWTTYAHNSNRLFALVRTSSSGKKQEGISFLLLDMDTPGLSVRPIIGNGGDHEFNEVFLEDVRVPIDNLVGQENNGWQIAKYLLEFERGGALQAGRVRTQFARLVRLIARKCVAEATVISKLGEIGTDIDAMEMIDISVLSALQQGRNPGAISSLVKLRWSQIRQDISELTIDVLGDTALQFITHRPLYELSELTHDMLEEASEVPRYPNYRAHTIAGGTTEIQKEVLARAMLKLN